MTKIIATCKKTKRLESEAYAHDSNTFTIFFCYTVH